MTADSGTTDTASDDDWRALPAAAIAALYINGVQRVIRENLFVFFGAGTGFAVSDALGLRELIGTVILVALGGLLVALIYHRRFRYRVDEDAVRVRQGLFEQKELKVRFERVQNIGMSQPVYLRPVKLVRLTLETPGAAQTEVRLPGIPRTEAESLRERIASVRKQRPEAVPANADAADSITRESSEETDDAPAFRPSAGDLFQYGLTSNQVWILLAIVSPALMNWVEQHVGEWVDALQASGVIQAGLWDKAPMLVALGVGVFVLLLVLLLLVLSGIVALVRFHGFELRVDDERFIARFGLFDARESTLKKIKMHAVQFTQTAIGRALGQWHAVGHQTGMAEMQGVVNNDRRFLVPGICDSVLPEFATRLTGSDWSMPVWQGIERRYRSMLIARICAGLVVVGCGVMMLIARDWLPGLMVAAIGAVAILVLCGLIALIVHQTWRRWGWSLQGRRMSIRQGFIGQSFVQFDLTRCQQIRVRTSPYQRRHGLATVVFRLPHGDVMLPYLRRDLADALADLALYRAESSMLHAL